MCGVGDLLGTLLVLHKEDTSPGWLVNASENSSHFTWPDCYFFTVCFVYLEKLRLVSTLFNVTLTSYGIVHGTNRLSNELVVIIYRYDFKNLLHVAKTYGSASAKVYHVGKKFKTLFILCFGTERHLFHLRLFKIYSVQRHRASYWLINN